MGRALGVAFCFHADARLDWPARAPTHTQGEAGVAFNRIVVSFLSVRSAGSGNADVDTGTLRDHAQTSDTVTMPLVSGVFFIGPFILS